LDLHGSLSGNSFANWVRVNPLHFGLLESILESPCHVLATCRSRVKYVIDDNKPVRVGMGITQRQDVPYEFDLVASMDRSHTLTVEKSLCHEVENAVVACPTGSFLDPAIAWMRTGKAGPVTAAKRRLLSDEQLQTLVRLAAESGESQDRIEADLLRRHAVRTFADLKPDQATEEIKRRERLLATRKPAAASVPAAPPAGASTDTGNGQAGRPATPGTAPASGGITEEQVKELDQLRQDLAEFGFTEEHFQAALAKRGAARIAELTEAAAAEFIGKLRARQTLKLMEAHAAGEDEDHGEGEPAVAGMEKSAGAGARPSPAP
jgi:hypothetical protein